MATIQERADREALRAFQETIRLETAEARAAFEHAVVEDFANAAAAYLRWTAALYRGRDVEPLVDLPHFAAVVDRILYTTAAQRRGDVEAAVRAERYGEAQEGA